MTDAQSIDAMAAGVELDVLVAEKVMGLKPCSKWQLGGGSLWIAHGTECDVSGEYAGKCYDASLQQVTPYSTDIAAAWSVVEHRFQSYFQDCSLKLLQIEWPFKLEQAGLDNWYAAFAERGAFGDTVPLAICRAALRADPSAPPRLAKPIGKPSQCP